MAKITNRSGMVSCKKVGKVDGGWSMSVDLPAHERPGPFCFRNFCGVSSYLAGRLRIGFNRRNFVGPANLFSR
jgi:hypothetical protein